MSLDGSTPNGAANDFFKFRFQQVVGFGSAEGDFQIAVVESTQFNSHGQAIALVMCLAIAGHTQQHANPSNWTLFPTGQLLLGARKDDSGAPFSFGFLVGPLEHDHLNHRQKQPNAGHDEGNSRKHVAGPRTESAGSTDAAKGTRQASALTSLNQHQQNHEQAEENDQNIQHDRDPTPNRPHDHIAVLSKQERQNFGQWMNG